MTVALIDLSTREIHAKIVFFGPELSGKTTTLNAIALGVPPEARGKLRAIDSESARTVFSDSLPIDLGERLGFRLYWHLYSVPGQARSSGPRAAVLHGADGIVFVAEATLLRMAENMDSLTELTGLLAAEGKPPAEFPFILACNKSDLPGAVPPSALASSLGVPNKLAIRAAAITGDGVFEVLRAISKLVANRL